MKFMRFSGWQALGVAFLAFKLLVLPLHAGAPVQPNILFIIADDLTACLGCYGNDICQTPNLDRLAAQGVQFERAYCQYPVCGPSRASLMSGLYPNRTKMLQNDYTVGSYRTTNPQLVDHPGIGEFLRRRGYFSARVSKIYHMGVPGGIESGSPGGDDPAAWDYAYNVMAPETHSPGVLELLSPKRTHYGSNFARMVLPDQFAATQADVMATTQAIAILEKRASLKDSEPFFLAVGLVRPHVPLIAPSRLHELYEASKVELPHVPANDLDDVPPPARGMDNEARYGMDKLQQKQSIAAYYASVSFMDEQVGRLLDKVDRLGLRDNTIVVFTSDHGYNLGEHSCWQKLSLFEESTRVPLIISTPGTNNAGANSSRIVELIDLYPTLAELAHLTGDAPEILQGTSLCPLLDDPDSSDWPKDAAYTVTWKNGQSIRTQRWRYNSWDAAGEELYDHQHDPQEFTNLAMEPGMTDVLNRLRVRLNETKANSAQ